jgi:hypothetical protein
MTAGWLVAAGPPGGQAYAQAPSAVSEAAAPSGRGTLAEVLRRLAATLPLDVRLDPAVARLPVDVDLRGLAPDRALERVLVAAGVDFVLGQRGDRLMAVVGDSAGAAPLDPKDLEAPHPGVGESSATQQPVGAEKPDDEPDDTQATTASGAETSTVRAPGEMTPGEMLLLLSPPPSVDRRAAGWVELPFPGEDGRPVRVWRPGGTPAVVELPFPDQAGQPLIQVLPARPLGYVELPFPDEHGRPIQVPLPQGPAPTTSLKPGLPPGAKPPEVPR